MKKPSEPLPEFVEVHCLCGRVHSMLMKDALESSQRWRCASCKRRFVLAHIPAAGDQGATVMPVYLDGVPSTGDTVQEGFSEADDAPPPDHLRFQCRCGCRLVARSKSYSSIVTCPKCGSRLALKVAYRAGDGEPVAMLEYPDDHTVQS